MESGKIGGSSRLAREVDRGLAVDDTESEEGTVPRAAKLWVRRAFPRACRPWARGRITAAGAFCTTTGAGLGDLVTLRRTDDLRTDTAGTSLSTRCRASLPTMPGFNPWRRVEAVREEADCAGLD